MATPTRPPLTASVAAVLPASEVYKILEPEWLEGLGPVADTIPVSLLHRMVCRTARTWDECPARILDSEWFRPRSGWVISGIDWAQRNSAFFSDEHRQRFQHLFSNELRQRYPQLFGGVARAVGAQGSSFQALAPGSGPQASNRSAVLQRSAASAPVRSVAVVAPVQGDRPTPSSSGVYSPASPSFPLGSPSSMVVNTTIELSSDEDEEMGSTQGADSGTSSPSSFRIQLSITPTPPSSFLRLVDTTIELSSDEDEEMGSTHGADSGTSSPALSRVDQNGAVDKDDIETDVEPLYD